VNASTRLMVTETKLQFRDWSVVTFGLVFPTVLLLILGFAFPGFRDPNPELDGGRLIDLYAPIVLVFILVMVGVTTIAGVLASYRHDGILRRLRTTPVGPTRLLAAQLAAQFTIAGLGTAFAFVAALMVLDVPRPASWPGVIVALLLTAAAMFSIGLLIGAMVPSTSAAQAVSLVVWMPIMVLAGLWFPREGMPELMRRISDFSPGGAGVDAVQQAWFGSGAPLSNLAVLAAFAIATGGLAAGTFRWE
jgi:ABC-2 type transport system permease protein